MAVVIFFELAEVVGNLDKGVWQTEQRVNAPQTKDKQMEVFQLGQDVHPVSISVFTFSVCVKHGGEFPLQV